MCSNHLRARFDLIPPNTLALMRTTTPIPAVARHSNRLIKTSALISPSNSFIYGGGNRRIQLTIADRYTNNNGSSLSTSKPFARVSVLTFSSASKASGDR